MKKIEIPQTDLTVSEFGLGTAGAGVRWGKTDADADAVFGAYLDEGGNLIDTAHVYSDWAEVDGVREIARSERVIGDWMQRQGNRHQLVLMSKGGHPDLVHTPVDMHQNRCTRAGMRADLEASLRTLQTDYIDIYFYHRDDESIPVEEMAEVMEDFVREGKIRYFGVSNWSSARIMALDACCKEKGYRGPAADEAMLNLASADANPPSDDTLTVVDEALWAYHEAHPDNLLMPFSGNANGFFHKYAAGGENAVRDMQYATEKNLALAARFPALMEKYGCSVTNLVLGWFKTLNLPCVPLYAPIDAASVRDAAKSFSYPFDPEDYKI